MPDLGCWQSALAFSKGRSEDGRRELVRAGLLESQELPRQRTRSWYTVLPPECIPTSSSPTPAEVSNCAGRLDGFIRQARLRGTPHPPQGREGGGGASPLPEVGDNPTTSPPPSKVGAVERPKVEDGEDCLGGDSSDQLARCREIMERTAEAFAMDRTLAPGPNSRSRSRRSS